MHIIFIILLLHFLIKLITLNLGLHVLLQNTNIVVMCRLLKTLERKKMSLFLVIYTIQRAKNVV